MSGLELANYSLRTQFYLCEGQTKLSSMQWYVVYRSTNLSIYLCYFSFFFKKFVKGSIACIEYIRIYGHISSTERLYIKEVKGKGHEKNQ